jgi:hypothetical protein
MLAHCVLLCCIADSGGMSHDAAVANSLCSANTRASAKSDSMISTQPTQP